MNSGSTVDLVIGVVFSKATELTETDNDRLQAVVAEYYPTAKSAIIGIGPAVDYPALLHKAAQLNGDLVIVSVDSLAGLPLLLEPLRHGYALTLGCHEQHRYSDDFTAQLVGPILAATYGWQVSDLLSPDLALANTLVNRLVALGQKRPLDAAQFGFGIWALTTALTQQLPICTASLGSSISRQLADQRELVFRQVIRTLWQQVRVDYPFWSQAGAVLQYPGVLGLTPCDNKQRSQLDFEANRQSFRQGMDASTARQLKAVLAPEIYSKISFLMEAEPKDFELDLPLWTEIVYSFLLAAAFCREYTEEALVSGLLTLTYARQAALAKNQGDAIDWADQIRYFHWRREELLSKWAQEAEREQPALPAVAFWEFIPGMALTLPQEVTGTGGRRISLIPIYEELLQEYRHGFIAFVRDRLQLPETATSAEISQDVAEFMRTLESEVRAHLLSEELTTVEGMQANVGALFQLFPNQPVWALTEKTIRALIQALPPTQLLSEYECSSLAQLYLVMSPRTALTLAIKSEVQDYTNSVWRWLRENAGLADFEEVILEPLVVSGGSLALNPLTGQISAPVYWPESGGEFPGLHLLTGVGQKISEAQAMSQLWQEFAASGRREFIGKVVNSLAGSWGSALFSVSNLFNNGVQRRLVQSLRQIAERLPLSNLLTATDIYPLAITLNDGTFIPFSIATWANYSAQGGQGVPGPWSVTVERDWFSWELLQRAYRVLGEPATVDQLIVDYLGRGDGWADLAQLLLPVQYDYKELFVEGFDFPVYPPAGELKRYPGNPILKPIPEHSWESTYVLNCAAIRLAGRIYILYRAYGQDRISRIGLAVSEDGFQISERLAEPIFGPGHHSERAGCEDPRVVVIDGRLYMTYTAYDGQVPQIAIASISKTDFLDRRWGNWQRHGLTFPNFPNKDAIIFPEKINGQFALYHRIAPSIWLTYGDSLDGPWPKTGHKILLGPRYGLYWDAIKIGAGTQPLKTRYGWLMIYHGVDYAINYSLGVMLVDLEDPGRLLYRSPNPILVPTEEYERGERGKVWVPNVVFTCGAVPLRETELLEDEDEVLVYYGAADTYIGVATARVGDLLPENIRK